MLGRTLLFGIGTLVVVACTGSEPVIPPANDAGTDGSSGTSGTSGNPVAGKLAFVTKDLYNGKLGQSQGGAAAGDATCAKEAADAGMPGRKFRALVSVGGANALDRVTAGPWVLSKGENVPSKANWGDTDNNRVLVNRAADGTPVSTGELVWTGCDDSGKPYLGDQCANWTDDQGAQNGRLGQIGSTDTGGWLSYTNGGCAEKRHIYCFEEN